jgi:hypothetical protein
MFLRERLFRRCGNVCGRLMAALLLPERLFRQRGNVCGRLMVAPLLLERLSRQCGSLWCCLMAAPLISKVMALFDESDFCWRVVSLAEATFVSQQSL